MQIADTWQRRDDMTSYDSLMALLCLACGCCSYCGNARLQGLQEKGLH